MGSTLAGRIWDGNGNATGTSDVPRMSLDILFGGGCEVGDPWPCESAPLGRKERY